jgi:hypothetical protein
MAGCPSFCLQDPDSGSFFFEQTVCIRRNGFFRAAENAAVPKMTYKPDLPEPGFCLSIEQKYR